MRDRKKPGRFSEERQEPDDQMAGAEGGDPDDPRFREPRTVDPREEVKKRSTRYVMEDPEESGRRRHPEDNAHEGGRGSRVREKPGGDASYPGPEEREEEGLGNESRPHAPESIPEERAFPEEEDVPGSDPEDSAWERIDRDY